MLDQCRANYAPRKIYEDLNYMGMYKNYKDLHVGAPQKINLLIHRKNFSDF